MEEASVSDSNGRAKPENVNTDELSNGCKNFGNEPAITRSATGVDPVSSKRPLDSSTNDEDELESEMLNGEMKASKEKIRDSPSNGDQKPATPEIPSKDKVSDSAFKNAKDASTKGSSIKNRLRQRPRKTTRLYSPESADYGSPGRGSQSTTRAVEKPKTKRARTKQATGRIASTAKRVKVEAELERANMVNGGEDDGSTLGNMISTEADPGGASRTNLQEPAPISTSGAPRAKLADGSADLSAIRRTEPINALQSNGEIGDDELEVEPELGKAKKEATSESGSAEGAPSVQLAQIARLGKAIKTSSRAIASGKEETTANGPSTVAAGTEISEKKRTGGRNPKGFPHSQLQVREGSPPTSRPRQEESQPLAAPAAKHARRVTPRIDLRQVEAAPAIRSRREERIPAEKSPRPSSPASPREYFKVPILPLRSPAKSAFVSAIPPYGTEKGSDIAQETTSAVRSSTTGNHSTATLHHPRHIPIRGSLNNSRLDFVCAMCDRLMRGTVPSFVTVRFPTCVPCSDQCYNLEISDHHKKDPENENA